MTRGPPHKPPGRPDASVEVILDTSAWKALLDDEPAARFAPQEEMAAGVVITPIVLAELASIFHRGRFRHGAPLDAVESRSRLEPATREDALFAGRLFAELRRAGNAKVSLGDCLIYATASRIGAHLVTADRDLVGQPGVVLLRPPT